MKWIKNEEKQKIEDYLDKHIAFYPYTNGFGLRKADYMVGRVYSIAGSDTMFISKVTHGALGDLGNKVVSFSHIRIIDSW